MHQKSEEDDILTARGAAAAVVMLIGGPLFFLLWLKLVMAGAGVAPFGWTWHAPALATLACTVLAYFMPETFMEFIGRLVGGVLTWLGAL